MATKANQLTMINQIFELFLEQDKTVRQTQLPGLVSSIMTEPDGYYLVAGAGTTDTDWKSKEFSVYVSEKKELYVFIDRTDARQFAAQNGLLSGNSPMVIFVSYHTLEDLVERYRKRDLISRIKIFARRPLFLYCPLGYFGQNHDSVKKEALMSPSEPVEDIIYPQRKFTMVDDVKKVLDLAEVSKRRVIDPGLICENLHAVIEKLIQFNKLDINEVESQLRLPSGMLRSFCQDRVSSNISKATAVKLLRYFGLEHYLYQYKKYCTELISELNHDDTIDVYEIKPANVKTAEKFKLVNMARGCDTKNNAYVYELTLKSKTREIKLVVSTPLNYVIGKSYEIVGIDSTEKMDSVIPTEKNPAKMSDPPAPVQKPQRSRNIKQATEEDPEEADKSTVIGYLKKTYGDNFELANKKLQALGDIDIIHAFAFYIRTKRPGKINEAGYTPGYLMQELHMEPFEAYKSIADLRRDPKGTKQMLIYRKTDPQYQKQEKKA